MKKQFFEIAKQIVRKCWDNMPSGDMSDIEFDAACIATCKRCEFGTERGTCGFDIVPTEWTFEGEPIDEA